MAGIVKAGMFIAIAVAMSFIAPLFFYSLTGTPGGIAIAEAAEVDVWWPTEGKTITGTQPFKGMMAGQSVESYQLFWQVDGGQLNAMPSSYDGYPHKEALVDLSGWKWKGSGPYVLTFVAMQNGNVFAKRNVTVYTGPQPTLSAVVAQPTASTVQPAPVVTPLPVVAPAPTPLPIAPAPAPLPVATVAASVENHWPVDGKVVVGVQPFKGIVANRSVDSYQMFWQVDGGGLVEMRTNHDGYAHKEALVDLSGWKWKGVGPYRITFVAKENGATIGQKSFNIYAGTPTYIAAVPTTPTATLASSVTTVVTTPAPQPGSGNPLAGARLYVDPNNTAKREAVRLPHLASLLNKIGDNPTARWFGDWNPSIQSDVNGYVTAASSAGAVPVLIAYNIPGRDCGNYSAGGAGSLDAYRSWIRGMADGIAGRKAVVVLEPDALALTECLSDAARETRFSLVKEAISMLKSKGASVYLDAGHAGWVNEADMAARLAKAGVASADGFALNVSNFGTTEANASYGERISALAGGKHFVIDTSRNGRGSNGEWCNPWGRGLGQKPTGDTGKPLIDGYLWLKAPGESDGNCNGGPSAGTWWLDMALELARNAAF